MNLKFPWQETKAGCYQIASDDLFAYVFPDEGEWGWRYALFYRGERVGGAIYDTNICAMFAAEEAMIDVKIDESLLEGPGAGPPLGLFGEAE